MKKRIDWLDNLRGFAIIAVVIGHMPISAELETYIYSFHLPLFFAISGMAYGLSSNKNKYGKFILAKAKRLILPYFLLNLFFIPLWYVNVVLLEGYDRSVWDTLLGILYSNQAKYPMATNVTWFISALFILIVAFRGIEILSRGRKYITPAAVAALGITGAVLSINGVKEKLPYHIQTLLTAIVFFYLGVLYIRNRDKLNSIVQGNRKRIILILLFLSAGGIIGMLNGKISRHLNEYNNLLLFYAGSVFSSCGIVLLIKALPHIKLLNYLSKNSLLYVAAHCPILRFITYCSPTSQGFVHAYPIFTGLIIMILIVPLAELTNSHIPFLVGNFKKTPKANTVFSGGPNAITSISRFKCHSHKKDGATQ